MARTKKASAARMRRKAPPWDSDRTSSNTSSSEDVLMAWFTTPGNAKRWHREKRIRLLEEIIQLLKANGISHRTFGDLQSKIMCTENSFTSATAFLLQNGQLEAFQRGDAASEIIKEALKLCPRYRELQPIFGSTRAEKKMQIKSKSAAHNAATESEAKSVAGAALAATDGHLSAAGDWKNTLEKMRTKNSGLNLPERLIRVNSGVQKGAKENKAKLNCAGMTWDRKDKEKSLNGAAAATIVVKRKQSVVVADEFENANSDRVGTAGDLEKCGKRRKLDIPQSIAVEDENEGAFLGDEDADADLKEYSDRNSARRGIVKRTVATFKSAETSFDEDENDKENKSASDKDVDEEIEEKGKFQLTQCNAPPADNDLADADDGEGDDQSEVDEEDKLESDESEGTDEEVAAELTQDKSSTSTADMSDDSSTIESGGADTTFCSTQSKSKVEQDEEFGEDESKSEQDEESEGSESELEQDEESGEDVSYTKNNDVGMEEDAKESNSSPESKQQFWTNEASRKATRDLERVAFVERVKQERDQRDELFQLERAKLECELQLKQVQLTLERSLARKKLLGAGVDPNEVDRVLPV